MVVILYGSDIKTKETKKKKNKRRATLLYSIFHNNINNNPSRRRRKKLNEIFSFPSLIYIFLKVEKVGYSTGFISVLGLGYEWRKGILFYSYFLCVLGLTLTVLNWIKMLNERKNTKFMVMWKTLGFLFLFCFYLYSPFFSACVYCAIQWKFWINNERMRVKIMNGF